MDSLRSLPPDAGYTAKSGQAGLKLTYRDGNIHAVATCDSLQELVFRLEEELHQARDRLERQETEIKPAGNPIKQYLYGVLTGIILAISFYLFIKYGKKWRNIS